MENMREGMGASLGKDMGEHTGQILCLALYTLSAQDGEAGSYGSLQRMNYVFGVSELGC